MYRPNEAAMLADAKTKSQIAAKSVTTEQLLSQKPGRFFTFCFKSSLSRRFIRGSVLFGVFLSPYFLELVGELADFQPEPDVLIPVPQNQS